MAMKNHVAALNLRHLQAWVTVVDEGSVTAGAKVLGVSQPALSQQLQAIESMFGGPLLERLHRGVIPTQLGRAVLSDARVTLASSERLIRQARSVSGMETGTLELIVLPTLVDAILIEPIREWRVKFPSMSLHIREFPQQAEMTKMVANGLGDLAIGVRPPEWTGPVVPLGWEQFLVVLPPDDPLAVRGGSVDLQDLADHKWILYEPVNGLKDYVNTACALAGFRPKEAVSTSQVEVAVRLATTGLGVALVPAANALHKTDIVALPLDRPIVWEMAAFTRSSISPPAAAFVDLLKGNYMKARPTNAIMLPGN